MAEYMEEHKNEEFEGTIIKMYNSLFLVKTIDGQIRSYSYADVLISNLEITKLLLKRMTNG